MHPQVGRTYKYSKNESTAKIKNGHLDPFPVRRSINAEQIAAYNNGNAIQIDISIVIFLSREKYYSMPTARD